MNDTVSDSICAPTTACTALQYERLAATYSSDRTCDDVTVCVTEEYETTAPSLTTDRTCYALTVCAEDEYASVVETINSDRECTRKTSAPTTAPTKTPSLSPTKEPTAEPTAKPSMAPTNTNSTDESDDSDESSSNPTKPVFNEADFSDVSVAAQSERYVIPLAKIPDSVPKGFAQKEVTVEVAVVEVGLKFAVPAASVRSDSVLQLSLCQGLAASVGLDTESVTIIAVDGEAMADIDRQRQLDASSEADITFHVESKSVQADQVEALKESVVAAANEGSIVAHVQKKAFENGVLTEALMSMPRIINAEVTTMSVTKTIVQTVKVDNEPTKTPTASPEFKVEPLEKSEEGSGAGVVVGGAVGGIVGFLVILFLVRCLFCGGKNGAGNAKGHSGSSGDAGSGGKSAVYPDPVHASRTGSAAVQFAAPAPTALPSAQDLPLVEPEVQLGPSVGSPATQTV